MSEEVQSEWNIGLSSEEKDEIEKLILDLKESSQTSSNNEAIDQYVGQQIKYMRERMAQLSEILLNYDSKIKTLYEIVCLTYKKSKIMNKRIDGVVQHIKNNMRK